MWGMEKTFIMTLVASVMVFPYYALHYWKRFLIPVILGALPALYFHDWRYAAGGAVASLVIGYCFCLYAVHTERWESP